MSNKSLVKYAAAGPKSKTAECGQPSCASYADDLQSSGCEKSSCGRSVDRYLGFRGSRVDLRFYFVLVLLVMCRIRFLILSYRKRKYCNRQKIRTRDFDESPRFRPP
ncbi:hypothetical protein AVEN_30475-1 [Araneus ventricosus]|uniref:Uncharacterized protein n=1 Tax=Araneus ventricosus TaxID=182803 RepID=A0A4Y2STP1_ARAVE|nr:hypothetical protein AVEN_30475-1 [Araneus ventricosus]